MRFAYEHAETFCKAKVANESLASVFTRQSKAVHNALIVAKDTGCDTVQIFSRNPRGWMAKPLTAEDVLFSQDTTSRQNLTRR